MTSYEPDRIFVGGLPNTVDSNEKLLAFFQQFGPVRESKVFVDLQTGRPKGFGFIRFEYGTSVEAAIANDANNVLDGKWVSVKRCEVGGSKLGGAPVKWQGAANSVEDAGLWVRGLPLEFTDSTLKQFFEQYGQVVDCKVLPRRYPNNPDQAGLVRMASPDQAQWCCDNLNNTTPVGFTMAMTVRRSNKSGGTKPAAPDPAVNMLGSLGWQYELETGGLQPTAPAQTVLQGVDPYDPYLQAALHAQTAAAPPVQPIVQLQDLGAPAPPAAPMHSALPLEMPTNRLWVKGLPVGFTDNHLRELFSAYGTVTDCQSVPQRYAELDGVVCMQSAESAQLAVSTLNGRIPMGFAEPISVVYAKETSSIDGTAPVTTAPPVQHLPPPPAPPPAPDMAETDPATQLSRALNMISQSQPVGQPVIVQPPPHRLQALGLQPQPEPPPQMQPPPMQPPQMQPPLMQPPPMQPPQMQPPQAPPPPPQLQPQAHSHTLQLQPQPQPQSRANVGGPPPKVQELDRIFVGGLPQTCDMETLALFFSQFGGIKEASVNVDQATGRNKGFGFVRFADPSAVDLAMANDVNNIIDGKYVTVRRAEVATGSGPASGAGGASTLALTAQPMSVLDGNTNDTGLWIRGLPLHFSETTLRAFFEQYVQVIDCKVLPRKFPENPDQAGLVRVATASMAKWCIDSLNGQTPPGFPIPVTIKLSTSSAPTHKHGGQAGSSAGSSQSITPLTAGHQAGLEPAFASALAVGSNSADGPEDYAGAVADFATGVASSISPLMSSDPAWSNGSFAVGGVKRPADGWADDEASKYLKM